MYVHSYLVHLVYLVEKYTVPQVFMWENRENSHTHVFTFRFCQVCENVYTVQQYCSTNRRVHLLLFYNIAMSPCGITLNTFYVPGGPAGPRSPEKNRPERVFMLRLSLTSVAIVLSSLTCLCWHGYPIGVQGR